MNFKNDSIIGIVGGMGPQAGLLLFNKIVEYTKAKEDQQHLSVVLMSFPKHIVDRTSFLEGSSFVNPAFSIAEIIRKLKCVGASVIGMACNTSYSPQIYDVIREELDRTDTQVKLIHMPFETCQYIRKNHLHVRRVGIMATNGTYKSGVYKKIIQDLGYEIVLPDFKFQNNIIHRMIYDAEFGIKATSDKVTAEVDALMEQAICFFRANDADAVILGCTELSLIKEKIGDNTIIVDSTEILAKALIREATSMSLKAVTSACN